MNAKNTTPSATKEGEERLSWAPIEGGMRLNAEASERCWKLVHTQYAFCVLKRGAADWNYRGRRFTVVPGKVYVLEPGEVHTTLRAHTPGDFSVSFLDAQWMARFSADLADLKEPHFGPEGLDSARAWRGLVDASDIDPAVDAEGYAQRLSASLAAALHAQTGQPNMALSKPTLERAKRALMERYLAAPGQRIRLQDVVRDLDVGYHRFVHEFSRQFGSAPYQYVKMLRARYVVERLRQGPSADIPSLTVLARHAGCSDMPHLSRELKHHFGLAPRELARQLDPNWVKRSPDPLRRRATLIVMPALPSTAKI